jgi:hypothetical protein
METMMMKPILLRFVIITVLSFLLSTSPSRSASLADRNCGSGAYANWNLKCEVTKNTIATNLPESLAYAFTNIKTITVCASFNNHGGLNDTSISVIYNYADKTAQEGDEITPLSFFDTVRFKGEYLADRFSWVGTSPRRSTGFPGATTMRGRLLNPDAGPSVYAETLAVGQKPIGEMQTSCRPLQ